MRGLSLAGVLLLSLYGSQAHAIGCITGGLAGAAAGHLAHHGIIGALTGCIAGHEYNKHLERQQQQQDQQQRSGDAHPQQKDD